MVEFIEKNGEFFLRKQHDFALREDAARELINQGILPGTNIAQFYFDSLVQSSTKIAISSSHLNYEEYDDQATDISEEYAEEGGSTEVDANLDPLGELLQSIREIEQRFSDYGIEIQVRVKPFAKN
jgi:hypothetical protein